MDVRAAEGTRRRVSGRAPQGSGPGTLPGGSLHLVLSGRPRKGGRAPETPGPSNGIDNDQNRDSGSRHPTRRAPYNW